MSEDKRQIGVGSFKPTPEMKQLVNEVLDSGRLSYGDKSREFESRFAKLHGCKFGVLSNSGTSSLHVAVQTLKELHGWEDGAEVFVPATTFVATINVLLHNRLTPVLVDVNDLDYNMDAFLLPEPDTAKAIIPVHLFGQPANLHEIGGYADKYGLKIIEDSCECMFATHLGHSVGSMGDIGCFSTYIAHLIMTGVGGIATTNNPDYAAKMRSLVNHGRDGIYISIDDDQEVSHELVSRRFNFESIGHSFRITEIEAALGLAQLDTYEKMIATRVHNARSLSDELEGLVDRIQLPSLRFGNTHSFMMYPIVIRGEHNAELRDRLCLFLEENGIETRGMLPLIRQPAYKGLWEPENYPVADWLWHNGFYVGCHPDITTKDVWYMADKIHEFFTSN